MKPKRLRIVQGLLLAVCLAGSGVAHGQGAVFAEPFPAFCARQPYGGVTTFPHSSALVDYDGDGPLDLVFLANFSSGFDSDIRVAVRFGRGDGRFGEMFDYALARSGSGKVGGDYNGDGRPDIAVWTWDSVRIVLNIDGLGIADTQPSYPLPDVHHDLAAGDLDGDGHLDVVVTNSWDGTVSLFYGLGDGRLEPAGIYPAGTPVGHPVLGDYDGDGDQDLAVIYQPEQAIFSTVMVLLRQDDGGLSAPLAAYTVGSGADDLAAADLDENGTPDLIVTYSADWMLTLLLGVGNGTFVFGQDVWLAVRSSTVDVGDMNGDGHSDLVVHQDVNYALGPDEIEVLLGDGNAHFQPTQRHLDASGWNVHIGDLDGDQRLDVVSDQNGANVFLGKGDGQLQSAKTYPIAPYAADLAVADFNGDGRLDVATAHRSLNAVQISLRNADGTLTAGAAYPVGTDPHDLTALDVDHDGLADLAASGYNLQNSQNGWVQMLRGHGDGSFAPAGSMVEMPTRKPESLVVGDLDSDGFADLVLADAGHNRIFVLTGNADGSVAAPVPWTYGTEYCETRQVEAADIDDDADPDLVVTTNRGLLLRYNDGDAAFGQTVFFANADFVSGVQCVTAADFNGDGLTDLAVGATPSYGQTAVAMFLGAGGGQFVLDGTYTTALTPKQIRASDFDLDGDADLVVANGGTIAILYNDGYGAFSPPQLYGADLLGSNRMERALVDWDQDGLTDILFNGNGDPGGIAVLSSTCRPECRRDGDVDGNGAVSAGDAQLAFHFVLETLAPSWRQSCAADCNGDGIVTAGDAQQVFFASLNLASCAMPLPGKRPGGPAVQPVGKSGGGPWVK